VSARNDAQIERFDTLEVEGFTLSDSDSSRGATRHFERDHDLGVKVRKAIGGGDQQAVLLISLGIDDHDTHLVQLDYRSGHYGEGAFSVVSEAIETLEVIRQQLNVMQATPGARFVELNACERGRKAERDGAITKLRDDA
jgi:hypothetical protein